MDRRGAFYWRDGLLGELAEMLRRGATLRECERALGIHRDTAARFKRALEEAAGERFRCGCGALSGHRGWCRFRYERSERRKATMRKMHERRKS